MKTACEEGKRTVVYTFEELTSTLISRVEGINIPLTTLIESGVMAIEAIEPSIIPPTNSLPESVKKWRSAAHESS